MFLTVAAVILIWAMIVSMVEALNRQRISDHIEASGGEVIQIVSHRWGRRIGGQLRTYDVTYKTRHGKKTTATCVTSMMSGTHWLTDKPPDSDVGNYEQAEAAEAIRCLECGARSPREKRAVRIADGATRKLIPRRH
jgi:hypothetical protein